MPNRSNAQEEKRRLLLDAAVRVFARKGYHASRVGDIAEEAGVAYGLLYHYFESKEDVLLTVFRETWRGADRDDQERRAGRRPAARAAAQGGGDPAALVAA